MSHTPIQRARAFGRSMRSWYPRSRGEPVPLLLQSIATRGHRASGVDRKDLVAGPGIRDIEPGLRVIDSMACIISDFSGDEGLGLASFIGDTSILSSPSASPSARRVPSADSCGKMRQLTVARGLRERVLGVACLEARRHARGAQMLTAGRRLLYRAGAGHASRWRNTTATCCASGAARSLICLLPADA